MEPYWITMDDESIFIGGYIIHREYIPHGVGDFRLFIENTLTGEELDVAESELTKLLDGFWKKLRR